MINKKIFELPNVVSPLQDTDILAIVQGIGENPETRKINIATFKASVSGTGPILDITHADMLSAMSSNNLIKGALYKIVDFQTIHQIPNTTTINTGIVEPLVCLAISNSNIDGFVFSQLYPEDTIEYNIQDVVCEDDVTARKGKIIYRKDTLLCLETYYDFRNIKFRRWAIDGTGMTNWAPSTAYSIPGQLVYEPSTSSIYALIKPHTSDSTFNTYNSITKDIYWVKVMEAAMTNTHAWNTSMNEFSQSSQVIAANPSLFEDHLTFASGCKNIFIAKSNDVPLNNVVFLSDANNCRIDSNVYNVTIEQGDNDGIAIAQNSNGIVITNGCGKSIIKNNCKGIVLQSHSAENIIEEYSSQISLTGTSFKNKIGYHSSLNYLDGASACVFEGSNTNNIVLQTSSYIHLSPGSSHNQILEDSINVSIGIGSLNNKLVASSNISIGIGSNDNFISGNDSTIGNNSSDNTINDSAGNTIGNNCSNNSIGAFKVFDSSNTLLYSEASVNNIINDGCADNVVLGSNNTLQQSCSAIVCNSDSGINGCFFASGVKNKTFTNTSDVLAPVQNLSILVRTNSAQTFDINGFAYNDLVFNSRDAAGDVWAPKVDADGIMTMIKLT